ncbi:hypothetical protein HN358_05165, partial [Candidatus Uhrbacteria bacterium]|nr:hypothetical protein [Candidatus Uhrbacteria bacterium]
MRNLFIGGNANPLAIGEHNINGQVVRVSRNQVLIVTEDGPNRVINAGRPEAEVDGVQFAFGDWIDAPEPEPEVEAEDPNLEPEP